MNNKEKRSLQWLLNKHKNNLELCLKLEDFEYIKKTKKDFDKNSVKAVEKYQNKIRTQNLKSNLL